ncbi:uncharacterized protein LOC135846951 [Planococcus citri]|uniref:uncharacterized protein LOC135846951 n=1 Tax=Planococcus citri TaxID=170843 RepID=UPI0031F77849
MKSIYVSILLFYVVIRAEDNVKKTNSRDVNDAVSADYALTKIPVYVIPNTLQLSEAKVPVAVIPGAYPPATYYNPDVKETPAKPHKYGFYAPYKTPNVTPIHEPQQPESYATPKFQHAYAITDLNQKSDYNENPSYKVAVIGKDYQTSQTFVKYESTPKSLPEKHQSLSHGNIYASLAPVVGYSDQAALGYVAPKKIAYDYQQQQQQAEHQPPTQYYIKYVPVPYAVPEDQYQNIPDTAYITPKTIYKSPKKPAFVPEVEASTPSYAYSNEAYQDTKYAASYAPSQEAYQYPEYKYVQPAAYKYYDKNVYAKKYVPTSYLVATLGKEGSTHYAANIQHDSSLQEHAYQTKLASPLQEHSYATKLSSSLQEPSYTTKLAPVPLPVDKYVVQDSPSSQEENKYSENGYAYVYPSTDTKYKPLFSVPQQYSYDSYGSGSQHYNKKDVESVSSTKSYESSTSKL